MSTDGAGHSSGEPEPEPQTLAVGTLRDFVRDNGSLLAAIAGLLGIATFVSALPLYAAWVQPYLVFLLLVAAVLIWLELITQWPPALVIFQGPPPRGTPWRLVGFAYAMQLTMVGLVGGFFWRIPRLAMLTLATAIGALLWRYLVPESLKERRGALLATVIVALLIAVAVTSLSRPTYESIIEPFVPPGP